MVQGLLHCAHGSLYATGVSTLCDIRKQNDNNNISIVTNSKAGNIMASKTVSARAVRELTHNGPSKLQIYISMIVAGAITASLIILWFNVDQEMMSAFSIVLWSIVAGIVSYIVMVIVRMVSREQAARRTSDKEVLLLQAEIDAIVADNAVKNAKAAKIEAETENIRGYDVITAPADHQVIIREKDDTQTIRKVTDNPALYQDTERKDASEHDMALHAQRYQIALNKGVKAANNKPLALPVPNNITDADAIIAGYTVNGWEKALIDKAHHVHIAGPTRCGKTTMIGAFINRTLRDSPDTEIVLINPKHMASKHISKPFPIEALCKSMESAGPYIAGLYKLMEARQNDPEFDPRKTPRLLVIVDEWDSIKLMHGKDVVHHITMLIKMGGEMKIKVILLGQSILVQDTGINTSNADNMARIAITSSAVTAFENGKISGITKEYKESLRDQSAQLASLDDLYEHDVRFCLTLPMSGKPAMRVIAHRPEMENNPTVESIAPAHPIAHEIYDYMESDEDEQIDNDELIIDQPADETERGVMVQLPQRQAVSQTSYRKAPVKMQKAIAPSPQGQERELCLMWHNADQARSLHALYKYLKPETPVILWRESTRMTLKKFGVWSKQDEANELSLFVAHGGIAGSIKDDYHKRCADAFIVGQLIYDSMSKTELTVLAYGKKNRDDVSGPQKTKAWNALQHMGLVAPDQKG